MQHTFPFLAGLLLLIVGLFGAPVVSFIGLIIAAYGVYHMVKNAPSKPT
ncbi:hypothetical protein [Sphingosinicella sp. YJ22]|nr:hypothetical protein [Sphingosinicella sp. YJ22]